MAFFTFRSGLMGEIDYIHNNPVRAGIVSEPDHYVYSSAIDYTGANGLVNVDVIKKMLKT